MFFIRYEGLFWRPNANGYTSDAMHAGLYSEDEIQMRFGHTTSDRRNQRGDYPVEVGYYLHDNNIGPERLVEMGKRLAYFNECWVRGPRP